MAKRSLRPQLNQIRAWVRQGRTDAWIAHQLEVSASELREFRRQHDLSPDEEGDAGSDVDLRDEIEAEIEAAAESDRIEKEKREREEAEEREKRKASKPDDGDESEEDEDGDDGGGDSESETESDGSEAEGRPRRRRRRRRSRGGRRSEIEATFDHGESDGYGLWLDPSVKDLPAYRDHWAGNREVTVTIEQDRIIIRRAGESGEDGSSDD